MADGEVSKELRNVGLRYPSWKSPLLNLSVVLKHRFLVRNLVRREIRGKYRNAALGYLWTVLEPMLLASVYYFLFVMIAGNPDELYPIWVLLGVIVWSCFGRSLTGSVTSLTSNRQTIHLVYFPRIIFPITSILGVIVVTMMSALIAVPIIYLYDLPLTIYLIYIPLSILLAGFLGIGLGMAFAPLNCMYEDIEHLFRFIVRAGFFVSPVMWTYEMAVGRGAFEQFVLFNPMVVPLTMVRHGIEGTALPIPMLGVIISIGFALTMWIIGSMLFNRFEAEAVKHL
ncbi:MAG: ABC transporter permease [archaeon]|nr:ABC transporter permease [archaeon]MDA1168661.1 ABC transporter permease [archaeon]